MVGVVAVLVLVSLSVIVTRIGADALEATGVSHDLAHFQARSAFTGVGYTTSEAESVANHPVRRRVVLTLMLLGNAGIVSVVASLVLGFSGVGTQEMFRRLGVLIVGLGALWLLTRSERFHRAVKRASQAAVGTSGEVEVQDYVQLLDLSGPYAIRDLHVQDGEWLADTELRELDLTSEGVLVLGIRRPHGDCIGAPYPDTCIRPGGRAQPRRGRTAESVDSGVALHLATPAAGRGTTGLDEGLEPL